MNVGTKTGGEGASKDTKDGRAKETDEKNNAEVGKPAESKTKEQNPVKDLLIAEADEMRAKALLQADKEEAKVKSTQTAEKAEVTKEYDDAKKLSGDSAEEVGRLKKEMESKKTELQSSGDSLSTHFKDSDKKNDKQLDEIKQLVNTETEALQITAGELADLANARVVAIIEAKKAEESFSELDKDGPVKTHREAAVAVVHERYELAISVLGKKKDYVNASYTKRKAAIDAGETENLPTIELVLPPGC